MTIDILNRNPTNLIYDRTKVVLNCSFFSRNVQNGWKGSADKFVDNPVKRIGCQIVDRLIMNVRDNIDIKYVVGNLVRNVYSGCSPRTDLVFDLKLNRIYKETLYYNLFDSSNIPKKWLWSKSIL